MTITHAIIFTLSFISGLVFVAWWQLYKHARILEDLQSRLTISVEREVDRYMYEMEMEEEAEEALRMQELLDKRR